MPPTKEPRAKGVFTYVTHKKFLQDEDISVSDPVFIDGISIPVKFKPLIKWGEGETPKEVIYTVTRSDGTTTEYRYDGVQEYVNGKPKKYSLQPGIELEDVVEELGVGGKLEVYAVTQSGKETNHFKVPVTIAPPPFGLTTEAIKGMINWDPYALEYGFLRGWGFPILANNFGTFLPSSIPLLGGEDNGISVEPPFWGSISLTGNGSIKVGMAYPFNLGMLGGEVTLSGEEINLTMSLPSGVEAGEEAVKEAVEAAGGPEFSWGLEIKGELNFDYIGERWSYTATFTIGIEGEVMIPVDLTDILAIPVFVAEGVGVESENMLRLRDFIEKPSFEGEFGFDPYGKIMAGIGDFGKLSAGVYSTLGPHLVVRYPKITVKAIAASGLKVTGVIPGIIKLVVPGAKEALDMVAAPIFTISVDDLQEAVQIVQGLFPWAESKESMMVIARSLGIPEDILAQVPLDRPLGFLLNLIIQYVAGYIKELGANTVLGVRAEVACFELSLDLLKLQWKLITRSNPGEGDAQLDLPDPSEVVLNSSDGFKPVSRDYLSSGEPYARYYSHTLNPGRVEKPLQTNVYPYSEPVVVSRDGQVYAFWIYDDPARPGLLDRTKLVYSRVVEGVWSPPGEVWDDGTADFSPRAGILPDGKVLVVWENARSQLPDDAQLEDLLPKLEIAYGVYDPVTDTWDIGQLTDDEWFDYSPNLSVGDGEALLTWTKNKENSLFANSATPDTLYYALWNGGWSTPEEILTVYRPVNRSSLAYNGTHGYLVWESDEDGNIGTRNDVELRLLHFSKGAGWGEPERLTNNNYRDSNPQVLFDNNDPVLFWAKERKVLMARNLVMHDARVVLADFLAESFKAMSGPKEIILFWTDTSKEGVDIYMARWDREINKWGLRQKVTADDLMERDVEGAVIDANRFILIYNKDTMKYQMNEIPKREKTDLYYLLYEDQVDLAARYLFLNNPRTESQNIADPTPVPGDTITLTVEVANVGDTVEKNIPVIFYEGGQRIGSATVAGYLAPREAGRASLNWTAPEKRDILVSARIDPNFAPNDANRKNDVVQWQIATKMVAPPVAAFTYSPSPPQVGEPVTFDASSSFDPDGGTITKYIWDFGDGSEIVETDNPVVQHTFDNVGRYDVCLTVRDDKALSDYIILTVVMGVGPGERALPLPSNMFTDLIINPGEIKTLTEDIFVSGKLINYGTFQPGDNTIMLIGTGVQEIKGNIPGKVVHSGSGTLQLIDSATIGEFLNLAGNFNANGHTLTVTGPATISGGSYQAGIRTQTFNGGLAVSGGTFSGSSGDVHVKGDLILSGGTFSAPDTLYVSGSGNWFHPGGTFNHNNGTVVFNGTTGQLITGDNTFYNLSIDNTSPADKVDASMSALTVRNNLRVQDGIFWSATEYGNIYIGPDGTLELDSDSTVSGYFENWGNFVSNGIIRKTPKPVTTGYNTFGLTGVKVNVTDQGSLSQIQVDRKGWNHSSAITPGLSLGEHWTITPSGSNYTVDLILPVPPVSPYAGFTHNRAKICRFDGSKWDCFRTSSSPYERIPGTDKFAPVVVRSGITTLSDWVVGDPELELVVIDNPDPVVKNQTLTYNLTVTNVSPSSVSNVTLTNTLPSGVIFQSATATLGGICTYAAGVVTCTWTMIPAGTSAVVTITVTAPSSATTPLLINYILNTATVTWSNVSSTVTTGTTVINTDPGTSAMSFSSSSWFTGTFTIDADADCQKDDTVYFVLTDSNSDGLYDTIDFSMNNTTFREGDTADDIISLTLANDETATTADLNGRVLNFGPTPARFKLSRLDASPVAAESKGDPEKDAGIRSPWYVGTLSIDIDGDQEVEDLDFVLVDPEEADYLYTRINIDRDDSGSYSSNEEHQSGELIMLGGMRVQVTFLCDASSLTFTQGKITKVVQAGHRCYLIGVPAEAKESGTQDNVRIKIKVPDTAPSGFYKIRGVLQIIRP